jgi:hypothetical protein
MSTGAYVVLALIFTIPVVAVIGGITAGIFKTRGQQRLIELAQRERIAAIEKGIDPERLPPLPLVTTNEGAKHLAEMLRAEVDLSPRQRAARQAQGFQVTGIILLSIGLGLSLMLLILPEAAENRAWVAGILPGFIGVALLICASIVRKSAPADNGGERGPNA